MNGSLGIITLNRPNALNALDLGMIRKIHPALMVCLQHLAHFVKLCLLDFCCFIKIHELIIGQSYVGYDLITCSVVLYTVD